MVKNRDSVAKNARYRLSEKEIGFRLDDNLSKLVKTIDSFVYELRLSLIKRKQMNDKSLMICRSTDDQPWDG